MPKRRSSRRKKKKKPDISYDKISWRLNPEPPTADLVETGIPSLDGHIGGGLRKGLHTFWGQAGTGKSMMARSIAHSMAENMNYVLYLCCEVMSDAPIHDNVDRIDYTRYLPNAQRALQELEVWIDKLSPSLVIIDSMTSFFSISRKALPESELRQVIAQLHMETEGKIPVIGISEVRGRGFTEQTAGGAGVEHACNMLVKFERKTIRYRSDQEAYNMNYGDTAYFLTVEKDKLGLAGYRQKKVVYKNDLPTLQ